MRSGRGLYLEKAAVGDRHENKLSIMQNKRLTDVMLTAAADEGTLTGAVFNREMSTKERKTKERNKQKTR